ncbi:MAG: magnesium transporter [Candidatus Asgardarchaeia archaeon]
MTIYKASKIIRESMPCVLLLLIISWITGDIWENISGLLLGKYSIFLIILPGYISAIGSIGSVYVSRLSSHILIGDLDEHFKPRSIFLANILGLFVSSIIYFSMLSIAGFVLATLFQFPVLALNIFIITIGAGLISIACIMIVGTIVTFFAYKKGLDPDNFTSPLMSNLGDLFGSLFLGIFVLSF